MQKTSTFDLRLSEPIFENCPACQRDIAPEQKECFSCGVVFSNFAKFQFERDLKAKVGGIDHLSIEALKSLDQRWKRLVVNYHDQDAHQAFVRRCFVEEAIPFAVFCYSCMLEIDGEDDIASLMRRQALQLLTVRMETAPPEEAPMPRPSRLFQWGIWSGLFVSALIVAMGLSVPQLHNLIGLGVSLLFIFLFAQVYRRRFLS